MRYIVPEYYKDFACKCGECRQSCCDRWPIRISMKEYYYLLGVNCSEALRSRLDCALKMNHRAGSSGSAQISTDWLGNCMMHREDGYCAIQSELGESSLPGVCRLYPRNTRNHGEFNQCSCSNSCEKVVELLRNLQEPLHFEEINLDHQPEFELHLSPSKQELCNKAISILQERRFSLPERFLTLNTQLGGAKIISDKPDHLSLAFQLLCSLTHYFESSVSISEYSIEIQRYYNITGREMLSAEDIEYIAEKHTSASAHLSSILPDWENVFEQLIVNHMFYNDFPYTNVEDTLGNAFLILATTYSFLRFHILGYMVDKTTAEALVDIIASLFRVIEHSNFREVAHRILSQYLYPESEVILQLIYV